jgi:hypothetical protein
MKITTRQLRQIIREELLKEMEEPHDSMHPDYVHIGFGRWKKRGEEDKEGSQTFKRDGDKFTPMGSGKKSSKSAKPTANIGSKPSSAGAQQTKVAAQPSTNVSNQPPQPGKLGASDFKTDAEKGTTKLKSLLPKSASKKSITPDYDETWVDDYEKDDDTGAPIGFDPDRHLDRDDYEADLKAGKIKGGGRIKQAEPAKPKTQAVSKKPNQPDIYDDESARDWIEKNRDNPNFDDEIEKLSPDQQKLLQRANEPW